jgi:hypothetical protein
LNRAFACLALLSFVALPRSLGAQNTIPDALRGSALVIHIHAVVPLPGAVASPGSQDPVPNAPQAGSPKQPGSPSPEGAEPAAKAPSSLDRTPLIDPSTGKPVAWQNQTEKYTLPGRPVSVRFMGTNFVIVVQITPFAQDDGKSLTLVGHCQVWIQGSKGKLAYYSAIDSLAVAYGETVLFYPLGIDAASNTPLRLEISVARASDEESQGDKQTSKAEADRSLSDKAPELKPGAAAKPGPEKAPADKPAK